MRFQSKFIQLKQDNGKNHYFQLMTRQNPIRIYHASDVRIEKAIPRFTVLHYEACRVMTNGEYMGQTRLSLLHTNNRFSLSPTIKYRIKYVFPEIHEFAGIRYNMVMSLLHKI